MSRTCFNSAIESYVQPRLESSTSQAPSVWMHVRSDALSQVGQPSRTREYVRLYAQREIQSGIETVVHPVTAQSTHLIDFEFGDPIGIQPAGDLFTRKAETAAVVGLTDVQTKSLVDARPNRKLCSVFPCCGNVSIVSVAGLDL